MRTFIVCAIAVMSAGGCRHATQLPSACPPSAGSPGVIEERCPSAVPGFVVGEPDCPSAPAVCLPPSAASSGNRSFFDKCCLKKETRTPEIHVNVPAPKVIVQRSEKTSERAPAAARAPRPGNDVMLVPTTVYVPYGRMTPTGNVQMVPLNMTPGQPVQSPPPVQTPPPCNTPTSAPPPCNTPTGANCAPGSTICIPPLPPASNMNAAPGVDELNRRCNNLENKIDGLIDALNKSRANRAEGQK